MLVVRGLYSWLTERARRQYVSRISLTSSDKQRAWLGRCTSTTTCLGPELEFPSTSDLSSSPPRQDPTEWGTAEFVPKPATADPTKPSPSALQKHPKLLQLQDPWNITAFCFRTTYAQQVRFILYAQKRHLPTMIAPALYRLLPFWFAPIIKL